MVKNKWCHPRNVTTMLSFSSPLLEHLTIMCYPFYLTQEFTAVIATVVYFTPQTDKDMALYMLHDVLSVCQNKHLEAVVVVAEDFNEANLLSDITELSSTCYLSN